MITVSTLTAVFFGVSFGFCLGLATVVGVLFMIVKFMEVR